MHPVAQNPNGDDAVMGLRPRRMISTSPLTSAFHILPDGHLDHIARHRSEWRAQPRSLPTQIVKDVRLAFFTELAGAAP
jgi:hypothetical protein